MNPVLNKKLFLVKEHVGVFKAVNNYDVYDPNTEQMLMSCREENLGFFTKFFRFTDNKRFTPFDIEIKTPDGQKVLTVKRGVAFFISNVEVFDENDVLIGRFKQKLFSIGGKFDVLDANDVSLCTLKGNMIGWNFRFLKDEMELASVTKKWSGAGKEFFTSADNYILEISDNVAKDDKLRVLILAAVMCIDMVLKE